MPDGPGSALPPHGDRDAEDAFVEASADADTDELVELVGLAVEARRTLLAGRLFQLLDEHIDPEPGSALDRAARAARLWLAPRHAPEDVSWSELDEAWADARRSRVRRIKQRWRDTLAGVDRRIGRLDRRRR